MLDYPDPPLADGAVVLRPWLLDDLPLVEEAAADAELRRGTTLPSRYTPAAGAAFVERQWSRQSSGEGLSLAVTRAGEPVGCATLMLRDPPVADLGYWLVAHARGAGIGGTAVRLLVAWAVEQPAVESIEAFVADANTPSRRLLERLGFAAAGRRRHRVGELDAELVVYRLG